MTKLMILSCLDIEPMSVYDIKVFIDKMDATRWGNILIGSVQNAVITLERNKLIRVYKIEKNGKRKKTIYEITNEGQTVHIELIKKAISALDINYSATFSLGLSNIDKLDNNEATLLLGNRKQKLMEEKEEIVNGINIKQQYTDISNVQRFTAEAMIKNLDVQIELVNNLIELYRGK